MKTTKPLLEDKLVTWKRAYEAVLEEMSRGMTTSDVIRTTELASVIMELRVGAARTAAVLIQGVEHGDSSAD